MSSRKTDRKTDRGRPTGPGAAAAQTYLAGCGRTWEMASAEPDLAYTGQAFPECPGCPHRIEPDGTLPFCTLRPRSAPHPFAGLADLLGVLD